MPAPIPPNSHSVEVRSTPSIQEEVANVHKRPQPYPGMEDQMYPIHDRGMCEWISDAFWYIIDGLDSIYNYVVDKILSLLEKLNIIKPRKAAVPVPVPAPLVFSDKALTAIECFSKKSPCDQMGTLQDIIYEWEGDAGEVSELIHVLVHQLSRPLKHVLIESAGRIPEDHLGDYLLGMSSDQYDEFREKTFIKFRLPLEIYALGSDGTPEEEVPLLAMLKIMEAAPHPILDKGIDMDKELQKAKGNLTDQHWGYLSQAYKQRVDEVVPLEDFKKLFKYDSYGRREFIPLIKQVLYHVPSQAHRICKEILEGNKENRLALFQNNTVWAQNFLNIFLQLSIEAQIPSIEAQIQADPDGVVQTEIAKRLQTIWESKQKEDDFDGDAIKEELFKQEILHAVAKDIREEQCQSLRKTMDGEGWCMDDPAALLAKLDDEATEESVHAAMRAALHRI